MTFPNTGAGETAAAAGMGYKCVVARRVSIAIAILTLGLSGFALGGCGSSDRGNGTSTTQGLGSVIFRLRLATTISDITLIDASTHGSTTMYRLSIHGKAHTFACTTSCSEVGSQTAP